MNRKALFAVVAGASIATAQYRFNFARPLLEGAPTCLLLKGPSICTNSNFHAQLNKVLSMFMDVSTLPILLIFKLRESLRPKAFGAYSMNSIVIAEQTPIKEESTLLHELLHAYFFNAMDEEEKDAFHRKVSKILGLFTLETPITLSDFVEKQDFMEKLRAKLIKKGFSERESASLLRIVLFAGTYGRRCTNGMLDNYPNLQDSSEIFSFMGEEGIHPAFKHFYPFKPEVLEGRVVHGVEEADLQVAREINKDIFSGAIWETIEEYEE